MPFVSDEQRRAAFANMRGRGRGTSSGGGSGGGSSGGGGGGSSSSSGGGTIYDNNDGIGYSGNYLNGLPDYSDWYESLPNTTQDPVLSPSGPTWLQGEDTFDWSDWELGEGGYIWLIDPDMAGGVRELTLAEKLLLGIPIAAAVWWAAPGIGLAAAGGMSELSLGAVGGSATATLTTLGTQGGSLGFSAVLLTGLPMSVNDSMYTSVEGLNVVGSYPDLVSWIASLFD